MQYKGIALPLLERAIEQDPDFIEAQLAYAEANFLIWTKSYNTIRYSPDALDVMQQTLIGVFDEAPQKPYAIGLRIRTEIEQLNREQALAEARSAVFLHQDNLDHPWLKFVLGLALFASGEYEAAKEQFAAYEQLSPRLNSAETRELARQYTRLGEIQKSLSLLGRIPPEEANTMDQFRLLALANSRNGDLERAKLNAEKILKAVPWINLTWYKPQFNIYSDPAIFEDWAAAMAAAGYPETPYDLAKTREGDRLHHDELVELFSEGFVETHNKGPFGAPYEEDRKADGTISMDYAWANGAIFTGTWSIKGDQFCHRIAANHMGRENCNNVYLDRTKSTDDQKYVSNLYSYGVVHSIFDRVEK